VNVQTDPNNCLACGTVCASGVCNNGCTPVEAGSPPPPPPGDGG
jgi:hypothetical protein